MASKKASDKAKAEKKIASDMRKERRDRGLTKSGEASKRSPRTTPKGKSETKKSSTRSYGRKSLEELDETAALSERARGEVRRNAELEEFGNLVSSERGVSVGSNVAPTESIRGLQEFEADPAGVGTLARGAQQLGVALDAPVLGERRPTKITDEEGTFTDTSPDISLIRQDATKALYGEGMLPAKEVRRRAAAAGAAAARREYKIRQNPMPVTASEAERRQRTFSSDKTINFAGKEVTIPGPVETANPPSEKEAYLDRKTGEVRIRRVPRPNVIRPERPRSADTRARSLAKTGELAVNQLAALQELQDIADSRTVQTGETAELVNTGAGAGGAVEARLRPTSRKMTRREAAAIPSDEGGLSREARKYVKGTAIERFSDAGSKRSARVPAGIVGSGFHKAGEKPKETEGLGTPEAQQAFVGRVQALSEATDPVRLKASSEGQVSAAGDVTYTDNQGNVIRTKETGKISDTGEITYTDKQGNVVQTEQLRQYGGAPLTENLNPDDAQALIRRIQRNKRGVDIKPFVKNPVGRISDVVVDDSEISGSTETERLRSYINEAPNPTQREERLKQVLGSPRNTVIKQQETEIYRPEDEGKSLREVVQGNWAPYRDALKGVSSKLAQTTEAGQQRLAEAGWGGPKPVSGMGRIDERDKGGRKRGPREVRAQTEMTVDEAIRHFEVQEGTRRTVERTMQDFPGRRPSQGALQYRAKVGPPTGGGVTVDQRTGQAAPSDIELAKMQVAQPRLAYMLDRTRGGAMATIRGGAKTYAEGVVNDETINREALTKPLVGAGGRTIASTTPLGGGKMSVQFATPRGTQEAPVFTTKAPTSEALAGKQVPGAYPEEGVSRVSARPAAWFESTGTKVETPENIKRVAMGGYRRSGIETAQRVLQDRTAETQADARSRMAQETLRSNNIAKSEARRTGALNKALTVPTSPEYKARMGKGPLAAELGITRPVSETMAGIGEEIRRKTNELLKAKPMEPSRAVDDDGNLIYGGTPSGSLSPNAPANQPRPSADDSPTMYVREGDSFKKVPNPYYRAPGTTDHSSAMGSSQWNR